MSDIFSSLKVLFFASVVLAGLLGGCTSTPPEDAAALSAGQLDLQPAEILEAPLSDSAEAMAWFSLALTRERDRDYPGAIEAFQQAIGKDPENDVLYMAASRRLVRAGRVADAFALLEQLLTIEPDNVTARRWLGKMYVEQNEIGKAREQFDLAVALHPGEEKIYLEAIQLGLREKDMPRVIELSRLAVQHADHPLKSTEILVKLLIAETSRASDVKSLVERNEEIENLLETATVRFPETDVFSFLRAQRAIQNNQWDLAFTLYSELDRRRGGGPEIRTRILGSALRFSGGSARGLRTVQRVLEEQDPSSFTLYLQGLLHELSRQPDEALAFYTEAVALNPEDYEALRKMAILTYRTGSAFKASELLEQVLKNNSEDPEILLLAGQLFLGAEDYERARGYFERCLLRVGQGDPLDDLPLLHTQLAMSRLATGSPSRRIVDAMVEASAETGNLEWIWQFATRLVLLEEEKDAAAAEEMQENLIRMLEDCADRLPENPELEWLMGRSYVFQEEFDRAVTCFRRFETLAQNSANPGHWLNESFYFDLAAALERAGRIEESMKLFQEIISRNPEHHPSLNYLAYMWAERALRLEEALDYVQRAIRLDPENGSYIDTLGWVYFQQERYKDAYRQLKKSAELIPEESVVAEHLGDVLMKLTRYWEAMGYYRIALMLDPAERREIVEASLAKAEAAVSKSVAERQL